MEVISAKASLARCPLHSASATPLRVNYFLSSLERYTILERKFVLVLFVLPVVGCTALYAVPGLYGRALPLVALACAFGAIAAIIAHYSLFKPFQALVTMARAVGQGDFSRRLGFSRR